MRPDRPAMRVLIVQFVRHSRRQGLSKARAMTEDSFSGKQIVCLDLVGDSSCATGPDRLSHRTDNFMLHMAQHQVNIGQQCGCTMSGPNTVAHGISNT